jgi:hypothetical protein
VDLAVSCQALFNEVQSNNSFLLATQGGWAAVTDIHTSPGIISYALHDKPRHPRPESLLHSEALNVSSSGGLLLTAQRNATRYRDRVCCLSYLHVISMIHQAKRAALRPQQHGGAVDQLVSIKRWQAPGSWMPASSRMSCISSTTHVTANCIS